MAARGRATLPSTSRSQNTQYAVRSAEYGGLFSCADRNLGKWHFSQIIMQRLGQ